MTMIIVMMMRLLSGMKVIKNTRPKKKKMERELIPIAWHPSRWWNWCMSEDEKKGTEKLCGSNR